MSIFDRTALAEHEAPIANNLFNRMVEADAETLSEADKADMSGYLLRTWHKAAEAVMRPIQTRVSIEAELRKYKPDPDPFALDD